MKLCRNDTKFIKILISKFVISVVESDVYKN